jgi:hypothetical protein
MQLLLQVNEALVTPDVEFDPTEDGAYDVGAKRRRGGLHMHDLTIASDRFHPAEYLLSSALVGNLDEIFG